jgi:DNA polymerase-3 subunit epsilon
MTEHPFLRVAFLDFEASSLDADGWPIELGLSWIDESLEIQTFDSLIRPSHEWPEHAWSPASAAVHRIPRRDLDNAPDVTTVVPKLLQALDGRIALSDAPEFDQAWLDTLFAASDLTDAFRLRDFDGVTMAAFPSRTLDKVYEYLHRTQAPHRAGPDSRRLAGPWRVGLKFDDPK